MKDLEDDVILLRGELAARREAHQRCEYDLQALREAVEFIRDNLGQALEKYREGTVSAGNLIAVIMGSTAHLSAALRRVGSGSGETDAEGFDSASSKPDPKPSRAHHRRRDHDD